MNDPFAGSGPSWGTSGGVRPSCGGGPDRKSVGEGKRGGVGKAGHETREAVEEGVVAGGGVALLRANAALKNLKVQTPSRMSVSPFCADLWKNRCGRLLPMPVMTARSS